MAVPSPAEADHAEISTDVAPVTQAELLGYLNHQRFEQPSWIEGREWRPAVEEVRSILRENLAGLSLMVSQNRVEMARQVCHPINVQLAEQGVSVATVRTRSRSAIRLLERWLTLRLRLQTAKQYPALVRLAQKMEGEFYPEQIEANRPTCDMLKVMQAAAREFKVVDDKETEIAWRLMGEHLAHSAGLRSVKILTGKPPEAAAAENGEEGDADKEKKKRNGPKKARTTNRVISSSDVEIQLRPLEGTDRFAVDGSPEVELLIAPLTSAGALRARDGQLVYGVITRENFGWVRRSRAKRANEMKVGAFFAFRVSLPVSGRGVLLDPTSNLMAKPFLMTDDTSIRAFGLFADIKLRPHGEQAGASRARIAATREALLATRRRKVFLQVPSPSDVPVDEEKEAS